MLQILGEQPPALCVSVIKDPTSKPKHAAVFEMLLAAPPFPCEVFWCQEKKKETTLGTEQTPSRPSAVVLRSIKAVSLQTTGSLFIE